MARAFQAPVITAVNMNQSSIRRIHQDLDIPLSVMKLVKQISLMKKLSM